MSEPQNENKQSQQPSGDLGSELRELGQQIEAALRSAVQSDKARQIQQDLSSGMKEIGDQLQAAFKAVQENPRFQDLVGRGEQAVNQAQHSKVAQDFQETLSRGIAQLNEQLAAFATRMRQPDAEPSDTPPSDTPPTARRGPLLAAGCAHAQSERPQQGSTTMCGRFTLATPGEQVAAQFQLADIPELEARYNIAPTQPIAAVRTAERGHELALFRWGLVPSWAKDPSVGARMINARAETAAEKPSFRTALRQRRCIIPADGFYEWQTAAGGKQPFHITLADGGLLGLAGLYEHWKAPDGSWLNSCTILTTAANALMQPLHDRMPVILAPEQYALWLDPALRDAGPLQALLVPYPAEQMIAIPVSRAVNKVSNDGPALLTPAA